MLFRSGGNMEALENVNKAMKHLYELVKITGEFSNKERMLFSSYIEFLYEENECKKLIKIFRD